MCTRYLSIVYCTYIYIHKHEERIYSIIYYIIRIKHIMYIMCLAVKKKKKISQMCITYGYMGCKYSILVNSTYYTYYTER